MSIANNSDLVTAVAAWADRASDTDFTAKVPDFIALGEAELNRQLGPTETDQSLTGTVSSRSLTVSSYTFVEPIALFVQTDSSSDEEQLAQVYIGDLPFIANNGRPQLWAMDNQSTIKLDRPCDQAYTFRFRYRGRLDIASTSTNWLLTQHPDVYIAASLAWGAAYSENVPELGKWQALLDRVLPQVKMTLRRQNMGTLRLDPMYLLPAGGGYDITTDL